MREVSHRYRDPLDHIWLSALGRLGIASTRDDSAYATYDGRGVLSIATPGSLDADDCLAQMILHELCHALVQGPDSSTRVDWGLPVDGEDGTIREHACLRLQASILDPFGLRQVLAPTTDFREFYDQLQRWPLEGDSADVVLARKARVRAGKAPFAEVLGDALTQTRRVIEVLSETGTEGWIFERLTAAWTAHPSGFRMPPEELQNDPNGPRRCGDCASYMGGDCQRSTSERLIDAATLGCEFWEETFDCQVCGACCREGFDTLDLTPGDPFIERYAELVTSSSFGGQPRLEVLRPNGFCPCLERDDQPAQPLYHCRVYQERPIGCRNLERGSESCLFARRRLGLSV